MSASLRIVSGLHLRDLLQAAVLAPLDKDSVIATADVSLANDPNSPVAQLAASSLSIQGSPLVISPPASLAASWAGVRSTRWVAIDVSSLSERLERVWLPEALSGERPVILVNRLPAKRESGDPIAIGVWARFAHPRQRTGAAAWRERGGLAVEIALAVRPAAVLLIAGEPSSPVVFSSDDQVVAELAGRAYLERYGTPGFDQPGPWEHPLVQRATELGLGVRFPAAIKVDIRWLGDPGPAADAFLSRASHWLHRIGVSR